MANQFPLPADWVELLKLLTSRKIEFVISGGVAFSVHARAQYTADIDIVVYPELSNIEKFIAAFDEFGFSLKSQDPEQFLGENRLLRVGVEPCMIDVMDFFKGVAIEEVLRDRVMLSLEELTLPFVSCEHLILNKLAVGRPRDIADVQELRRISQKP
ncbi:MAG: nucleotidyltransferase [Bdellovibrionales bacterium]|nr:nucleotidyltransferase [Bdellovibrionales bacterium]